MKEFLIKTNFSLSKNISKLGNREKIAIKTILIGLCETKLTDKDQLPVRIEVTPSYSFQFFNFAKVMYEMGIDIASSLYREEDAVKTTYSFSPKPYEDSDFIKGIISSKLATDQFIKSFIDYEPSPIKSKPQK